jgi:phosphoglycerol geranylgeranyltransferase
MVNKGIYTNILLQKKQGRKAFAVLLDPDKMTPDQAEYISQLAIKAKVDYFFVGGSLVISTHLKECIESIKANCKIPVVLFPGSPSQVCSSADGLLYLSLISGRNPELLIGQHVVSAAAVKKSGLEVMPTGYMVVDGGAPTTVSYISNAWPIPHDKNEIAVSTAMAGEMLGMKLIYMDAGSGAKRAISEEMIHNVAKHIDIPLVIGGGITTPEKAMSNCKAGADIIVVGNILEKDPLLMEALSQAVHNASSVSA